MNIFGCCVHCDLIFKLNTHKFIKYHIRQQRKLCVINVPKIPCSDNNSWNVAAWFLDMVVIVIVVRHRFVSAEIYKRIFMTIFGFTHNYLYPRCWNWILLKEIFTFSFPPIQANCFFFCSQKWCRTRLLQFQNYNYRTQTKDSSGELDGQWHSHYLSYIGFHTHFSVKAFCYTLFGDNLIQDLITIQWNSQYDKITSLQNAMFNILDSTCHLWLVDLGCCCFFFFFSLLFHITLYVHELILRPVAHQQ